MYIDIIEKIKYGSHYDKIDTVALERLHDHLSNNKFIMKKLNTAVSKGFLYNSTEAMNWFAFLKHLYKLDTLREKQYTEKTAIFELILKVERISIAEFSTDYKKYVKKYSNKTFNSTESLQQVLKGTEITIDTTENLTELNNYLISNGYIIVGLADGYYGFLHEEDIGESLG